MRYIIPTKLVGVSFKNADGIDRQELIKLLKPEDILVVEHELHNPYDSNSHVVKSKGRILGHLSRSLAEDISKKISSGEKIIGIKGFKVTGNEPKKTAGVNIELEMERQ